MRTTTFALALGLWSTAALAAPTDYELFTDRGDTFMRAGTSAGLQVGSEVTVLGDKIANTEERRRVGTATVMEVWPTLARLALDDGAKADKAPKKFASLTAPPAAARVEGKPEKGESRKPGVSPPPPPPPAPGGTLIGRANFGGAGPWKLLRIWNEGDASWSNCTLALMPGNRVYKMPKLRGHDQETVALSNFEWKGPELDIDHTSIDVRCNEGRANFVFPP